MIYWKIELTADGGDRFLMERYRAVIHAINMDAAIRAARLRIGDDGERMTAAAQAFSNAELAKLDAAAQHFLANGFRVFPIISAAASRMMEP